MAEKGGFGCSRSILRRARGRGREREGEQRNGIGEFMFCSLEKPHFAEGMQFM